MARKKSPPYGPTNRYTLTDEHRAQLDGWAGRWIANALRTDPMTEDDRGAMRDAIAGMYRAAGLEPPVNVVFVPSPLVAALAGSFAAAIWHVRANGLPGATGAATGAATRAATDAATREATDAATREATRAATYEATYEATDEATYEATDAATYAATDAATYAATGAATRAATYEATRAATYEATGAATGAATYEATYEATGAATYEATRAATDAANPSVVDAYARFMLACCGYWYRMWNGGNQYSAWCSFLSFFRHVAKLDLPVYEQWDHYEKAAVHGGPRMMHEKFCIVSDFPKFIHRDEQDRPHCETGPFCEWRDGWALYYVHGVKVTRQIVMEPETLTPAQILGEENVEVRRVMIDRFGADRLLRESDATLLDRVHEPPFPGLVDAELWRLEVPDDEAIVMVRLRNSTREPDGSYKPYWLRVDPACETAHAAVAWTWGMEATDYAPVAES